MQDIQGAGSRDTRIVGRNGFGYPGINPTRSEPSHPRSWWKPRPGPAKGSQPQAQAAERPKAQATDAVKEGAIACTGQQTQAGSYQLQAAKHTEEVHAGLSTGTPKAQMG